MNRLAGLSTLTVVATTSLLLVPMSSARAEPPTCDGRTATIVGSPGQTITGTDGPDVIVSNGAVRILGGAGDDLICTTASGPVPQLSTNSVTVLAGPGDDVVDRRGDLDPAAVGLVSGDAGQDTIYGAPGSDLVNTDDGEHDAVSTGDGDDSVTDGGQGVPSADPDTVDLGSGDDSYDANYPVSPDLTVTGGDGSDTIDVNLSGTTGWTVDARHGQLITPEQTTTMRFSDFDTLDADSLDRHRRTHLTFIGSDASEKVSLLATSIRADLGGGDDSITTNPNTRRMQIHGDRGEDLLTLGGLGQTTVVDLNLASKNLRIPSTHGAIPVRGHITGVEDATVIAGRVTLTGTTGANRLRTWACQGGQVRGGPGSDVLSYQGVDHHDHRCRQPVSIHAYGDQGDDLLIGGPAADRLIGGPGHDTARGKSGRDTCQAEVQRSC